MKLSVAYTFDLHLIRSLAKIPQVKEIYGKLGSDIIGGGRATYMVKNAGWSMLKESIRESKKYGINLNYLLNAANLDGFEQTRAGQKKLRKFLDRLAEMGIEHVTVSVPYLLQILKSQYPQIKVRVGVFARIASAQSAKWWESLGADTLCISAISCNRRPEVLKEIRKSVNCDLQLIVNGCCLQDCPYELAHMNMLTHSSRRGSPMHKFSFDYCFLHCTAHRYRDPALFLKSIWIRPEDLHLYESMGFDNFKIIDRGTPPRLLLKRVQAYANRSFDGNLLQLIGPSARIFDFKNDSVRDQVFKLAPFIKPWKIKLKSILEFGNFIDDTIVSETDNIAVKIDNKRLDGFLESVFKKSCKPDDCSKCNVCKEYQNRALQIDEKYRKAALNRMDKLVDALNTGSLF